MAISIDWGTKVISVPKADLTFVSGVIYELNLFTFHLWLKDKEDDEAGITFLDTHKHTPPVTVSGVTIARVVEIINGYTVTFEDGQYAVNLVGANSNVADVTNVNQVSIRPFNSAGLTQPVSAQDNADALLKRDMSAISGESNRSLLNSIRKLMNKVALAGSTLTVYKEDDTTPAYTQAVVTDDTQKPIKSVDTA